MNTEIIAIIDRSGSMGSIVADAQMMMDEWRKANPDPVAPEADRVSSISFFYMHDNHTFTRLKGSSVDEILDHADQVEAGPNGSFGMLCPARIVYTDKQERRVGECVHSDGEREPKHKWESGKILWKHALCSDADIAKFFAKSANPDPML